jgi:tetratricopeptide (TPR) repeat protein
VRGMVRAELGERDGAAADYNRALELKTDYADAYYNRGRNTYFLGDRDGARRDMQRALELNLEQGEEEQAEEVRRNLALLGP